MAISFHIGRDQSEATPPEVVLAQTAEEGGIIAIRDTGAADDQDQLQYCYYILLVGRTGARGPYEGTWSVVDDDDASIVRAPAVDLSHATAAGTSTLTLIPAVGATTTTPLYIGLGRNLMPTIAQLMTALENAALATVRARMTPLATRGGSSTQGVRAVISAGAWIRQDL